MNLRFEALSAASRNPGAPLDELVGKRAHTVANNACTLSARCVVWSLSSTQQIHQPTGRTAELGAGEQT